MKQIIHSSSLIYTGLLIAISLLIYNHSQPNPELFEVTDVTLISAIEAEEEEDIVSLEEAQIDVEKNIFISESLSSAIKFSKEENYQAASFIYKEILNENPNHQIAATNLALINKRELGCSAAMNAIDHAINVTRGQRLAKALSLQGSCFIEAERYIEAIKSLNRAIEYRPDHGILWKKLAKAKNLDKHPIEDVITTYQRALALDAHNIKLRLTIAKLQYYHLDFNGSIKTLRDDYASIKTSYSGQNLLAWNYLELRKFNNAKKHIKLARRLDSTKSDILTAMQSYADKQYNSSINFIKSLKRKSPSYQYLLALNYRGKKWHKSAEKYLLKLDESRNHKYLAKLNLLLLNTNNKQAEDRLLQLNQFSKLRVLTPYIGYKGALIALKANNPKEAKIWLEELSLPSIDLKTNLLYADSLWQSNQPKAALEKLNALYDASPTNPLIIRKYASRLHNTQFPIKAEKVIRSLKSSDYKATDYFLHASLLVASKQANKALIKLAEGIEHWPNNTQLRFLLAQTLFANHQLERSQQQIIYLLRLDANHLQAQKFMQENFHEKTI